MNQKQMEYFLEVYRQGNIQSAADKLYVSRQGVSKMLKSLEEELGQLLFIRNPHGLVPTDYANALLRVPIQKRGDDLRTGPYYGLLGGRISLGFSPGMPEYYSQHRGYDR